MTKNRLEAFTDAIIAIAMTLIVLEIKVPIWEHFSSIIWISKSLIAYIISFIFISIYWNTHHHLFQLVQEINGKVLRANNFFLFCITLISFSTWRIAESNFAKDPITIYWLTIILCWLSYNILTHTLISIKNNSLLKEYIWKDIKGKVSTFILILWTLYSLENSYIAILLFSIVIILRFIPDSRLEIDKWINNSKAI